MRKSLSRESSRRPEIVRGIADELSKSLGVPVSRNVLEPTNTFWIGHGLSGPIEREPVLLIEKKLEWRVFEEDMPGNVKEALAQFRSSLMSYGRSIKAMHRVCSSNLPDELADNKVVRSPDVAREAAVVSMLSWLTQPQQREETYSKVVRDQFLPRSKDTTTGMLVAWAFDTIHKGATEGLLIMLLGGQQPSEGDS